MSFLVDPPWLFANGRAYARLAPEEAQGGVARAAGAACLAAYWGVGTWLYLSGPERRDFMVNWPGLRVPARRRTRRLDAAAAAILLGVYPLALWLGWDSGRRARPRGSAKQRPIAE
jgi:hypothetical protein